jgi:hypothetical protein
MLVMVFILQEFEHPIRPWHGGICAYTCPHAATMYKLTLQPVVMR